MKKFLSYLLMLILVASCLPQPTLKTGSPCASSASTALCLD